MPAVILTDGKELRLIPHIKSFPKPFMSAGARPILEIIIRQLNKYYFIETATSVEYLAELIEKHLGNSTR